MMNNQVKVEKITLKEDLYYKGQKILTYEIDYPKFSSEIFKNAVNRMNSQYRAEALAFQRYCKKDLYTSAVNGYDNSVKNDFPIRAYDAILTHQITYNKDCTVSLYFDKYEYTGGAHGNTKRYSDTWNLQDARKIELRELFNPNVPEKEYIFRTIDGIIVEQLDNENNIYFDNYDENIQDNFDINSFYLTDEGVVFYFQQYDIGPYSSGIIEFTIPYSAQVLNKPRCK